MKDQRPVNLNLFKFHFPLPAMVSIGHRVSGVVLFLSSPFLLWALMLSLESSGSYASLSRFLMQPLIRIIIWLFFAALAYHLCAGIKHLLMDLGVGETKKSAQAAAIITLLAFGIFTLLVGLWLW